MSILQNLVGYAAGFAHSAPEPGKRIRLDGSCTQSARLQSLMFMRQVIESNQITQVTQPHERHNTDNEAESQFNPH
jgi:hypothetical protein